MTTISPQQIFTSSPYGSISLARPPQTKVAAPLTSASQMSLLSGLGTNLAKPSNLRSMLANVSAVFESVSSLFEGVSKQAKVDKAQGIGVFDGASQFSGMAGTARELIGLYESLRANGSLGDPLSGGIGINQIGGFAQEYLMGRLQKEALEYVAKEVGINVSSLNFSNLAEEGLGYVAEQLGIPTNLFSGETATSLADDVAGLFGKETSQELSASAGKWLGAAGAAYAGYSLITGWGNGQPVQGTINGATTGAYIGTHILPGLGTVVGGAIGGLVGFVGGIVKVGKHPDQKARDGIRALMKENGIVDNKWQLTLADGSKFDIGRDGGAKLTNVDGSQRPMYNTDASNPLTPQVIGLANPLAMLLTGGDPKLSSDFAGYLTNAALSNTNSLDGARQNMLAIFKSFKLEPSAVVESLQSMLQANRISQGEFAAYVNGFRTLLN
jgi:hypothetical protein